MKSEYFFITNLCRHCDTRKKTRILVKGKKWFGGNETLTAFFCLGLAGEDTKSKQGEYRIFEKHSHLFSLLNNVNISYLYIYENKRIPG